MGRPDYLFSKQDLRSVLDAQRAKLKEEVLGFGGDYLLNASESDVHAYLLEKYRIEAPTLVPDQAETAGAADVKIDVSRDPMRAVMDRSRPFYLTGTEITIRVPFTGERDLFYFQSSSLTMNPPQGRVTETHLELSFRQLDQDGNKVRAEYEQTLKRKR